MSRIVKASLYYCDWSCQNTDTRRFPFEEPTFASLLEKLVGVFQIKPENTTVTWIDSDGDRIIISCDEELTDALNSSEGPVLKLHVKTSKRDTDVSGKCPWAWMFQRGHHADDGDHDSAEEDGDNEHHDDDSHPYDPQHFWDGRGCPLGFKHRGGIGNWGSCCPLRNATCPMGFGRRRSFCPMGFSSSMPFGFGNFCYPMGFGSGFGCPLKSYGMFGGYGCPLGFKPGSSGYPLRNYPCPMKAMRSCPMGFKQGGSGCPLRKSSCPMGFGKSKCSAKKEEPKTSSGED